MAEQLNLSNNQRHIRRFEYGKILARIWLAETEKMLHWQQKDSDRAKIYLRQVQACVSYWIAYVIPKIFLVNVLDYVYLFSHLRKTQTLSPLDKKHCLSTLKLMFICVFNWSEIWNYIKQETDKQILVDVWDYVCIYVCVYKIFWKPKRFLATFLPTYVSLYLLNCQ